MGFRLPTSPKGWYLLLFNVASFAGWASILFSASAHLASSDLDYQGLYSIIGDRLAFVQSLAALEVLHVMVGWVRSSLMTTAMQVASRYFLVWGVLYLFPYPEVRQSVWFGLMVYAWSLAEIIRYSFYALKELGLSPYPLVWARYTLFYVLYPLGVSGELVVTWHSLGYAREWKKWYYQLLILIMLNYAPGFVNMYSYMIKQRKKVL
ncbi:hypothetical protein EV182_005966, partial [Spiromyces aspiralis]